MLKQRFRSEVGYWVHRCAHRFVATVNAELAEEQVSYRQFQVLAWLSLEGDLTQADLARRMGVEPPTVVSVVDLMERDGLIERKACPHDRRKRMISPTSAAIPVWKRVMQCASRVNSRAIQGLSRSEVATLRKLLQRVHANLSESQELAADA